MERRSRRSVAPVALDHAEFLGLFIAEGCLRGGRTVVFTNSEDALRQRFLELTQRLFGINGTVEFQPDKTPNVLVGSTSLVRLLESGEEMIRQRFRSW